LEFFVSQSAPADVVIRRFQPGDESAFRTLNEAWITRFFALEAKDQLVLGDPQTHILQPGGQILFAQRADQVIGCCALIRLDSQSFELAKMAVHESAQGHGIGKLLMQESIDLARKLGARRLYLETNSKLTPALRLYARFGFRTIPEESLPPSPYARADVRMELLLG
jgi:N-acetylglutamate synthase-like GNAT family acetyltransferase